MNRIACLLLVACLSSCATGEGDDPGSSSSTSTKDGGTATPVPTEVNLPCDVQAMLARYCQNCHSNPPTMNAPMPLMTWADLTAPTKSNKNKSCGIAAAQRMRSLDTPMPPKPASGVPLATIAMFEDWVGEGMKKDTCAPPASDGGGAGEGGGGGGGTPDSGGGGGGTPDSGGGGGGDVDSGGGTPDSGGGGAPDTGVRDSGTVFDSGIRDAGRG